MNRHDPMQQCSQLDTSKLRGTFNDFQYRRSLVLIHPSTYELINEGCDVAPTLNLCRRKRKELAASLFENIKNKRDYSLKKKQDFYEYWGGGSSSQRMTNDSSCGSVSVNVYHFLISILDMLWKKSPYQLFSYPVNRNTKIL